MTIHYTCPHCGKPGEAADQFAGQSGPCPACGQQLNIPFPTPGIQTGNYQRKSGAWSLPLILLVAGGGFLICCGVGSLLLFPAVFSGRQAAKRMQSGNCVKQIVLALQNYYDTHLTFPPAVVTDKDGKPLYSGRVLLLPFMEQEALYNQFDKSKAWDSPENLPISRTTIRAFASPFASSGNGRCDFVFVTGAGTAFPPGKTTGFGDMQDGSANTLVVIETKAGPASWAAPGDWDPATGAIPPGYFANHTIVGFADGHVQPLRTNPPYAHSKAISTIAGGEAIPFEE